LNKEKLRELIADVLEIEKEKINDESGIDTLEEWDSFSHLQIFMELEERCNVKFMIEEIQQIKTFKELSDKVLEKIGVNK